MLQFFSKILGLYPTMKGPCMRVNFVLFVLKSAFDRVVLYVYVVFSVIVLSTKKRYSSFFKKVFIFQKAYFKVRVLKMFQNLKWFSPKTCWSLKLRDILKIPSIIFLRHLRSFWWLQNKISPKKRFAVLRQKPTQILPLNLLKGAAAHILDESVNSVELWNFK